MMSTEQQAKKRPSLRLFAEKILPLIIALLCIISVVTIGASMNKPMMGDESWMDKVQLLFTSSYVRLQSLWAVAGFVLMFVVSLLPYKKYERLAMVIYGLNVGLLVLVLAVGSTKNGTTGWFNIPFVKELLGERTIQPSELAKIAIILFLARMIAAHDGKIDTFRKVLPIIGYFLVPFGLIIAQPDFGTAIVYLVIFVVLLFVGGLSFKLFGIFAGTLCAVLPLVWFVAFGPVQRNRFYVFLNPAANEASAYHVTKSIMAIGSGGASGRGVFNTGTLSQLNYLPEKHTDFIFSVLGETFGFLGVVVVLVLFAVLVYRLLVLVFTTPDRYGSLVCAGVLALELAHIFENIAMTMGVMPITGIPLPFMSYGGSAMLANMLAMGIVLSVVRTRPPRVQKMETQGALVQLSGKRLPNRRRQLPTME